MGLTITDGNNTVTDVTTLRIGGAVVDGSSPTALVSIDPSIQPQSGDSITVGNIPKSTRPSVGPTDLLTGLLGGMVNANFSADQILKATNIPVTVSQLPLSPAGCRAFVFDSTQTMTSGIGTVVVGGGTYTVPVWCDGMHWRIG